MEDIIEIVKSIENQSILLKGFSKTIENEVLEQKIGFLGILIDTLVASPLENMFAGDGTWRDNYCWWTFLILPNPLTETEIQSFTKIKK